MQSNPDMICEVHETVDGYVIYRPDTKEWWCSEFNYGEGMSHSWDYRMCRRKVYSWKWCAIRKAKRLETEEAKSRREHERRRTFVEKKVWR